MSQLEGQMLSSNCIGETQVWCRDMEVARPAWGHDLGSRISPGTPLDTVRGSAPLPSRPGWTDMQREPHFERGRRHLGERFGAAPRWEEQQPGSRG